MLDLDLDGDRAIGWKTGGGDAIVKVKQQAAEAQFDFFGISGDGGGLGMDVARVCSRDSGACCLLLDVR